MALTIELKPGERVILGESLLTNEGGRTRLRIDGTTPILRERDIMTVEAATTPCRRLYLLVQGLYLSKEPGELHGPYFRLVQDIVRAAPSTLPHIEAVNHAILTGHLYKALKGARALIAHEGTLIDHAERRAELLPDRHGHDDTQAA